MDLAGSWKATLLTGPDSRGALALPRPEGASGPDSDLIGKWGAHPQGPQDLCPIYSRVPGKGGGTQAHGTDSAPEGCSWAAFTVPGTGDTLWPPTEGCVCHRSNVGFHRCKQACRAVQDGPGVRRLPGTQLITFQSPAPHMVPQNNAGSCSCLKPINKMLGAWS